MSGGKLRAADRWVIGLAIAAGLVLLLIGIRFLVVPQHAAHFFGIANPPRPFDLHHVVALRDVWLALILIGLALLRSWRELALCLALGSAICLGDAVIVAMSSGRTSAIAFHLVSSVYCGAVAWAAWKRPKRKAVD